MKHLPIGYKVENGDLVIDSEQAIKVKNLYQYYLEGNSLVTAATLAGIKGYHGTISRILSNSKYIGALNYPPIISKELFEAVQIKRKEKAKELGRDKLESKVKKRQIPTMFYFKDESARVFENPFQEAEYRYSLIFVEV